jgi:hypothetical protein
MKRKSLFYFVLACCLMGNLHAQNNITVTSAVGQDVNDFVDSALAGKGVYITNAKFSNTSGPILSDQIGVFQANGFTGFSMDSGIVMTTGNIAVAPGPNNLTSASQPITGYYSDAELAPIATSSINGCATLDFDFVGLTDMISFMYTFASEEYPEYVCSNFNDVFAFYVTGPDPETLEERTWNVAIIPGSVSDSTPEGIAVAINTINPGVPGTSGGGGSGCYYEYTSYYNDNTSISDGVQYDGYTSKLMATTQIVPCALYHMHLSVCNVGDNAYDSGVFLEYGSFSSPSTQLHFNRVDRDTVRVGCPTRVPFEMSQSAYDDGVCHITYGGTAVYGVDFTCTTDSGAVMEGDQPFYISKETTHYLNVAGIPGANLAQPKYIELYIETSVCPAFPDLKVYDTMRLVLVNNPSVALRDTIIECNHLCTEVGVEVVGGAAPFTFQWLPAEHLADPTAQYTEAFITQDAIYHVVATDRYRCASDTAKVTIDIHTSEAVDEVDAPEVKIYPNPTDGLLNIAAQDIIQVDMYNVSGQKVYTDSRHTQQLQLDTQSFAPGTYYLRVVTANGISSQTVVVR